MCKLERIKMLKAMEYIARQVNDEEVFDYWLMCGVADGDIPYSDLDNNYNEDLEYYVSNNDEFSALMDVFLDLMHSARKSGGLYCDGVVSGD